MIPIVNYPIYRKLLNNKSYYKIIDARNFEEIQIIGAKKKKYFHEANQYPEILFIQDLISFHHSGINESSEEEWNLMG